LDKSDRGYENGREGIPPAPGRKMTFHSFPFVRQIPGVTIARNLKNVRDHLDRRNEVHAEGILGMQSCEAVRRPAGPDIELLMSQYQGADPAAAAALVELLSPQLYRFFASQMGSSADAEDMLQDVWLRIHRVRHTYRPSEPLLPWVYAIARRVRVDSYRKRQRIASRERTVEVLPELAAGKPEAARSLPAFEELVASLPESQREVLTMLKVNELSLEEVARATSSTVGAVKQKAHRAYQRLRSLLDQSQFTQLAHKGAAK
jgi:RNA polymerase sigma-70 factor (ECF subfamily)